MKYEIIFATNSAVQESSIKCSVTVFEVVKSLCHMCPCMVHNDYFQGLLGFYTSVW